MSLKILMDPIYSSRLPGCSTAYKCKTLIEKALERGHDNWFFYWLVPMELTDEEKDWLPKHPNVRYIEYPYLKDRMREYSMFRKELDQVLAFNGDYWDFDVLWTSRTSTTPFARMVMSSPRQKGNGRRMKKIMVFEEMIIMDHRPTVAKSDVPSQELQTLAGYLAADVTYFVTDKEVKDIVNVARKYLAPSQVIAMRESFAKISQLDIGLPVVKEEKFRFRKGERPMALTFAGRMEKSSCNLHDVFDIMDKFWIMRGDMALQTMIFTVSQGFPIEPPKHTVIRQASREEFWKGSKEEMDLQIILHQNAEFSLTLVEPGVLGVPAIIIDADWSRGVWGDEYPFYAKGFQEAYGYVKAFYDDYDSMYAKFEQWQQGWFKDRCSNSITLYDKACEFLEGHEAYLETSPDGFQKLFGTRKDNENFQTFAKAAMQVGEFTHFELIQELGASGDFKLLQDKTKPGDRDYRRIVFATPFNEWRLMLKAYHGFQDASTTVGHLKFKG